ncbi:hypothetical protein [Actinophytocola sp.]|uniref:hypothetical protein n=1 Tax=Actinophytocola sp. TaxID=1872138 RepID=UPI0025C600E9|nr:hypothetical protein [Actinophytocola sp.]
MRHLFTEVAKGNSRPFVEALGDDVRWTIIGSTAWSGTCAGKEAVLADLLGPVNEQLMGRNIITANRFVAEDDLVVVEAQGRKHHQGRHPLPQRVLLGVPTDRREAGGAHRVRRHPADRHRPARTGLNGRHQADVVAHVVGLGPTAG